MAPTVAPEDMDHVAITIEENDRLQDKMQSAIPSVASETQGGSAPASSSEGNIQEVPSDAEVPFCLFAVE
jgi:hypothetical protein